MIFNHIAHADSYLPILPGLDKALAFLRDPKTATLSPGRHDIDGDRVFAFVANYQTKLDPDAVWESHRRYADVQVVFDGQERLGWIPAQQATQVTQPYDAEDDAALYAAPTASSNSQPPHWVSLTPGFFALFLPNDLHASGLTMPEMQPGQVAKVVVKVEVPS